MTLSIFCVPLTAPKFLFLHENQLTLTCTENANAALGFKTPQPTQALQARHPRATEDSQAAAAAHPPQRLEKAPRGPKTNWNAFITGSRSPNQMFNLHLRLLA